MTIHYFIIGKEKTLANIHIKMNHGRGQRFICKTGYQVEPSRWSNETETIRQRKLSEDDEKLVTNLSALKSFITSEEKLYTGFRSKEWLQGVIDKFNGKKDSQSNTLNGFIAEFIEKAKSGELKNKHGKNFAKGTISNYESFQITLKEYQGIYTKERLAELAKRDKKPRPRRIVDFEDVTVDFYNSFVAFLSNEGKAINTMDKHIGTLKYFMGKALIGKKHSNREFQESAFGGFSEESHAVYLTQDEIERIYRADLSKILKKTSPGREKARTAFIVLCETALRVSDYKSVTLSIKVIKGVKMIEVFMQKTGSRVLIPLTTRMNEILHRYNWNLPLLADQTINEYIKPIAKECKINEAISWPAQKFGKRYTARAEKWQLVTCHTGRRSAATNMYLAGVPVPDIMKITGHKTEKTFFRYIRVTLEETALRLAKHDYYKQMKVV